MLVWLYCSNMAQSPDPTRRHTHRDRQHELFSNDAEPCTPPRSSDRQRRGQLADALREFRRRRSLPIADKTALRRVRRVFVGDHSDPMTVARARTLLEDILDEHDHSATDRLVLTDAIEQLADEEADR